MARAVTGYMSEDNHFFPTLPEAQLHDAEEAIKMACRTLPDPVRADKFLVVLEALADQCGNYLDAYKKVNQASEDTSESGSDQGNDTRRGSNIDALEQQPIGGHEPLSDVGHCPPGAPIPGAKSFDGFGVRRNHARDVRRSENLATWAATEIEETREGDG